MRFLNILLGVAQVSDSADEAGPSYDLDDEVEFNVVTNRKTGNLHAENLQLICKAEQRREFGQVCRCPAL